MHVEAPKPAVRRALHGLRRPWIVWTASILTALVLLYGLLGYLVLPGVIKSQAEQAARKVLHRTLTIERVEVRPFTLRVRIHGAALREADGRAQFASIQDARVRLSPASLWYLAPVIRELHVSGVHVHLARTGPNHYNTDDMMAALAQQSQRAPKRPDERPARFSVYNIRIESVNLDFDDEPVHAHHTVSDLQLGLPFISSLPSKEEVLVEPLLSAVIDGAPLTIKGRARPFTPTRNAAVDLDLDGVDLPRYLVYLPFEPRFRMPSAQLDVHLHADFQQPRDQPPALIVRGAVTLHALQLDDADGAPVLSVPQLDVELERADPIQGEVQIARIAVSRPDLRVAMNARGELNLATLAPPQQAEPASSAPPSALRAKVRQFELEQASLRFEDANPQRPMRFAAGGIDVKVADVSADSGERRVGIDRIESGSAHLDLQQGLVATESLGAAPPAAAAPAKARGGRSQIGEPPAWVVSMDHLSIAHWSARVRTLGLPQPSITSVSGLALQADALTTRPGSPPGKVQLTAQINRGGAVSIAGAAGLAPLHADLALDLKRVDLLPAQPYVTGGINLLITRAELSARGHMTVDQNAGGSLRASYRGRASVGNLATVDKLSGQDFLDWKSLSFDGINARLSPFSLDIDRIALNDFFARVILDASGRINLQDIIRASPAERRSLTSAQPQSGAPGGQGARAQAQAPEAAPRSASAPPGPIHIRQVTLQGGRVQYTDHFIKPNYSADLADVAGAVTGLSSVAGTAAEVDLRGSVNNAPLTVGGTINPVQGDLSLDLKASVHGMELSPLSPYSGKYVGYGIERGKLSFEVAYKLEHRQLTAQNRLVLDQLVLGDKVDSPSATQLPVRLALALLKDRNGVIDVNLPIGGSLDDPQFSVGGLIVRVLVNLVTKAVTAPFAWIGSLFGHGEELQYLDFAPGSDRIDAKSQDRLQVLAKAMQDRPGLNLEIQAEVDRPLDAQGLRHRDLDTWVRAVKAKDLAGEGQHVAPDAVTVTPQEYPALLQRVFEGAKLPKLQTASGEQGTPAPGEMEKRLLAATHIDDAQLIDLGNRRSLAVEQWLQDAGHVSRDRLFLIAPSLSGPDPSQPPDAEAKPSRIKFSLR